MENKEIFISYKSEEFNDALWVKTQLEHNGFSCWMAPMSITGGASYAAEIPNAIQQCKIFVLILSNMVQESKWVSRELDQAINANKIIMPFMIKNCNLNDEFNFYLSNVQRYYAYIDKKASFEKMIVDIKTYLRKNTSICEENKKTEINPKEENNKPVKKQGKKVKIKTRKKVVASILATALAFIIITVSCIAALVKKNKVIIADTAYEKSTYTISIENKALTTDDLTKFIEFEDLIFASFKNCVFETDNLEVLGKLNLITLELSNCDLTDTQLSSIDFNSLETLVELNLSGNDKLTDLSVIVPATDTIEELYLNDIAIESFDWLKSFTKIKRLYIDNTGATNLDFLLDMAYLEVLSANNNEINHLNGLANTSILKTVNLANNKLTDISIISNSASTLQHITLDNNELSDLMVLSNCSELTQISANNNKLTSVSWTSDLDKLTTLCLSNNNITDIDQITQSKQLITLDISKNKLTSVDGIIFSKDNFVEVNFSDNQINTVNLPANCKYRTLSLNGNPLQNSSFLEGTNGFTIIFDYFEALDMELLKRSSFSTIYIVDCPTNRIVEVEKANYSVELITSQEVEKLFDK